MVKRIKVSDLKVGMYVELPSAWRAHPFLRNSFTISSQKQIDKIIEHGILEISINEEKGVPAAEIPALTEQEQPKEDLSAKIIAEKLKEVIQDKSIPPEPKRRRACIF